MFIGVLALQGSVKEHCDIIELSGDSYVPVKNRTDLDKIDGLIIPGGESTTLIRLLKIKGMDRAIIEGFNNGLKIWGTCAGLILLSRTLKCSSFKPLGLIDIAVDRNGYGTQLNSFEAHVLLENKKSNVRFIRAPRIINYGDDIKVLSLWNEEVVAVRSNSVMVTTFHPEVTGNRDFYYYFKSMISADLI